MSSFAENHPQLAKESFGWDPFERKIGSSVQLEWRCNNGHIFIRSIKERIENLANCYFCEVGTPAHWSAVYPELANHADGWNPFLQSSRSRTKRRWKCVNGHVRFGSIKDEINCMTKTHITFDVAGEFSFKDRYKQVCNQCKLETWSIWERLYSRPKIEVAPIQDERCSNCDMRINPQFPHECRNY